MSQEWLPALISCGSRIRFRVGFAPVGSILRIRLTTRINCRVVQIVLMNSNTDE